MSRKTRHSSEVSGSLEGVSLQQRTSDKDPSANVLSQPIRRAFTSSSSSTSSPPPQSTAAPQIADNPYKVGWAIPSLHSMMESGISSTGISTRPIEQGEQTRSAATKSSSTSSTEEVAFIRSLMASDTSDTPSAQTSGTIPASIPSAGHASRLPIYTSSPFSNDPEYFPHSAKGTSWLNSSPRAAEQDASPQSSSSMVSTPTGTVVSNNDASSSNTTSEPNLERPRESSKGVKAKPTAMPQESPLAKTGTKSTASVTATTTKAESSKLSKNSSIQAKSDSKSPTIEPPSSATAAPVAAPVTVASIKLAQGAKLESGDATIAAADSNSADAERKRRTPAPPSASPFPLQSQLPVVLSTAQLFGEMPSIPQAGSLPADAATRTATFSGVPAPSDRSRYVASPGEPHSPVLQPPVSLATVGNSPAQFAGIPYAQSQYAAQDANNSRHRKEQTESCDESSSPSCFEDPVTPKKSAPAVISSPVAASSSSAPSAAPAKVVSSSLLEKPGISVSAAPSMANSSASSAFANNYRIKLTKASLSLVDSKKHLVFVGCEGGASEDLITKVIGSFGVSLPQSQRRPSTWKSGIFVIAFAKKKDALAFYGKLHLYNPPDTTKLFKCELHSPPHDLVAAAFKKAGLPNPLTRSGAQQSQALLAQQQKLASTVPQPSSSEPQPSPQRVSAVSRHAKSSQAASSTSSSAPYASSSSASVSPYASSSTYAAASPSAHLTPASKKAGSKGGSFGGVAAPSSAVAKRSVQSNAVPAPSPPSQTQPAAKVSASAGPKTGTTVPPKPPPVNESYSEPYYIDGIKFESIRYSEANSYYQVEHVIQDEENECHICLEEFTRGQVVCRLFCFCRVHQHCIDDWFRRKKTGSILPQCPTHRDAYEIALGLITDDT